jgi:hypothetical protein
MLLGIGVEAWLDVDIVTATDCMATSECMCSWRMQCATRFVVVAVHCLVRRGCFLEVDVLLIRCALRWRWLEVVVGRPSLAQRPWSIWWVRQHTVRRIIWVSEVVYQSLSYCSFFVMLFRVYVQSLCSEFIELFIIRNVSWIWAYHRSVGLWKKRKGESEKMTSWLFDFQYLSQNREEEE